MTGGHQGTVVEPSDQRHVVRSHRPQSGRAFGQFVVVETWHDGAGVLKQFAHAGYGGCRVAAVLILGRADNNTVGTRHQI